MTDIWKNYAVYQTYNSLSERYYAFIAACYEKGIKAVARAEPFDNALDIACGAGDNTALVARYARSVTGIDLSAEHIRSAPIILSADDVTGRPGGAEHLTAGFVVGPGVSICPSASQASPSWVALAYVDQIVLHG